MPSTFPPKRIGAGDPISARNLNRVGEAVVQRLTVRGGVAKRVGTNIALDVKQQAGPSGQGGAVLTRFEFEEEFEDYITAKKVTGQTHDNLTKIAKPKHLRGFVATQTVSGEAWEIDPPYDNGEEVPDPIYALKVDNGTGVDVTEQQTDENGQPVVDDDGNPVNITIKLQWLDMNTDARRWLFDCA